MLRRKTISIALLLAIAVSCSGMAASQPPSPEKETALAQQPTAADQRGTEQSPAVIKILPAQKTAEEAEADRKERAEKAESDWWLIKLTGILGLVGFLQLIVFGIQARRLRQTVQVATQQSKDMERSITESARAATAMETVAKHIEISSKAATESVATVKDATARQMRATSL